jgi:hypothetical protein
MSKTGIRLFRIPVGLRPIDWSGVVVVGAAD